MDTSNVAFRWHYALKQKAAQLPCRPAVLGVLQQAAELLTKYAQFAPTAAFLFDEGEPLRKAAYPQYKWNRKDDDTRRDVRESLRLLRHEVLPRVGFRNLYWSDGYEAEDLIAAACLTRHADTNYVLVSSDKDLWQLLGSGVVIWDPNLKVTLDAAWLKQTHGVSPAEWQQVLAMSGDAVDAIDGVAGVGVKTAARYLRGALPEHTKAYQEITRSADKIATNLTLVRLPYGGCPAPPLIYDELSKQQWDGAMAKYKIDRLLGRCPGGK